MVGGVGDGEVVTVDARGVFDRLQGFVARAGEGVFAFVAVAHVLGGRGAFGGAVDVARQLAEGDVGDRHRVPGFVVEHADDVVGQAGDDLVVTGPTLVGDAQFFLDLGLDVHARGEIGVVGVAEVPLRPVAARRAPDEVLVGLVFTQALHRRRLGAEDGRRGFFFGGGDAKRST